MMFKTAWTTPPCQPDEPVRWYIVNQSQPLHTRLVILSFQELWQQYRADPVDLVSWQAVCQGQTIELNRWDTASLADVTKPNRGQDADPCGPMVTDNTQDR